MAKIPFHVKYKPQIESGEYKVETRSGKNVRIICWDKIGLPIIALVGDADDIVIYNRDGTTGQQMQLPSDLFIVTPEEELTEFEQEISDIVEYCKEHGEHVAFDYAKRHAKTLLALAKKELCNGCNANLEGYIKGQQDAKRQYDESVAYHFPTMPTTPVFGCDGIRCTNPHMDCINCPRKITGGFNTTCGTSAGNTSATDGKEHNPSFTD